MRDARINLLYIQAFEQAERAVVPRQTGKTMLTEMVMRDQIEVFDFLNYGIWLIENNIDRIPRNALFDYNKIRQMFLKRFKGSIRDFRKSDATKKRMKRFVKQNINRFLVKNSQTVTTSQHALTDLGHQSMGVHMEVVSGI